MILLKNARKLLYKILPYRPLQVSKEDLETQYTNKSWNYLKQIDELARYSVIVGYSHYFKQIGSVLDIGCGEGVLQEKFRLYNYAKYVGIDISPEAIRLASNNQDDSTLFFCADATTFCPDDRYDIIVFNECLYYLKDPLNVVKMYERFLKNDGLIIVSMHVTDRTKKIWNILENYYTIKDLTFVTNRSGTSWKVACWKLDCFDTHSATEGKNSIKLLCLDS